MIVLTLDLDWAPDFAIDDAAEALAAAGVRATWFVTHASPAVERLRGRPDLFELGAHPNFLPGSSHGETRDEVLAHVAALVPEAASFRCHGLVHGTALLDAILARTPWRIDATLLLPGAIASAPSRFVWRGETVWRVPGFFADDVEAEQPAPGWRLARHPAPEEGLRVFAFHPIHVALNSGSPEPYRRLRAVRPRVQDATREEVAAARDPGEGAATLFGEVVEELGRSGGSPRLRDLCQR